MGDQMGGLGPASQAFIEANARMPAVMGAPLAGNADFDFVAGMIPHDQGAGDMARTAQDYGTDTEARTFAEKVAAAQEARSSE